MRTCALVISLDIYGIGHNSDRVYRRLKDASLYSSDSMLTKITSPKMGTFIDEKIAQVIK